MILWRHIFSKCFCEATSWEDAPEGIVGGLCNETWQRISLLIFIFCGQFERNQFRQEAEREIGDFGDPLKLGYYTPHMRLGELVNGRLAMLSCAIIASTEFYAGMPATQAWFPLWFPKEKQSPGSPRPERSLELEIFFICW